jgi:DNA-binding transcriptional regulator YhcF (GntR family)
MNIIISNAYNRPIYEQIYEQIKNQIVAGAVALAHAPRLP